MSFQIEKKKSHQTEKAIHWNKSWIKYSQACKHFKPPFHWISLLINNTSYKASWQVKQGVVFQVNYHTNYQIIPHLLEANYKETCII